MTNLVLIVFHHVHVSRLNQHGLTITHRLEQILISLLLLDNLLFGAELLSLLPDPLLHDIVSA